MTEVESAGHEAEVYDYDANATTQTVPTTAARHIIAAEAGAAKHAAATPIQMPNTAIPVPIFIGYISPLTKSDTATMIVPKDPNEYIMA